MSGKSILSVLSVLLLALFISVPFASAGVERQAIQFHTNNPNAVPGKVLSPGSYQLRFLQLQEHEDVLITTKNGQHPVGFFLVTPVRRNHTTRKVKIMTKEGTGGNPARLTRFFYPGTRVGYALAYPARNVG